MLKFFSFVFALLVSFYSMHSQTEIPNGGFEEWVEHESGLFKEPGGDWWGTLNKLRLLGEAAPITTNPSTDAHSGNYSAKIENGMFGTTIKISGLLTTGYFDSKQTPPNNFIEGKPFTGRPAKLIGYYKYKAANGDSAWCYMNLTKWNNGKNKKDTIAESWIVFYDKGEMTEFERFEFPLHYYSEETPDTIKVSFLASAGTRSFGTTGNAQIGSIFWLDDVALEYATGVELPLMAEAVTRVSGNYQSRTINIFIRHPDKMLSISIYDINGRLMLSDEKVSTENQFHFPYPKGTYFYVVKKGSVSIGGGIFNYN